MNTALKSNVYPIKPLDNEITKSRSKKDYCGVVIGRLTVIEKTDKKTKAGNTYYNCLCSCGNTRLVHSGNLSSESVKSCGCLRVDACRESKTIHGLSHSRLDKTYKHIISRCYNEKDISFRFYGAKGITVCDEWRKDNKAFFAWALSNGYSDTLTIDRIDPFSGYSPENCRFTTMKEQANNKRVHHQ